MICYFYGKALQKYLLVRDGEVLRESEELYDALKIARYFRGYIYGTRAVRDYLQAAKEFIDKID